MPYGIELIIGRSVKAVDLSIAPSQLGFAFLHFIASTTAPTAISATPVQCRPDSLSPRKRNAKTATRTTLSLSMGATRDASPIFRARK